MLGQTDLPPALALPQHLVQDVGVGLNHSCATYGAPSTAYKRLVCWGGHDEFGQTSVPPQYASNVLKIAVGDDHTCVIRTTSQFQDGERAVRTLHCFGGNECGQVDVPADFEVKR